MENIIYTYDNNKIKFLSGGEMKSIRNISIQIDSIATKACKLLTPEQKTHLFNTSKQNIKPYYISGKNKGKERDMYDIDGVEFNKLWKIIYPYAYVSCSRSVYQNRDDMDDVISEIKINLFRVLQLYGPIYDGQTLSQRVKLIVNNVLTNEYNKRSKHLKAFSIEEDFDIPDKHDLENRNFWIKVPQKIKGVVELLLSGNSFEEVKKYYKIDPSVEQDLLRFVYTIQND